MQRIFLLTAFALLLIPATLRAQSFKAVGTIKSVDAEKSILYINANRQDRTVPIAQEAKVLGTDGNPLPDGLKAKELKEGAVVTVTLERGNGGPTVIEIHLGGQARPDNGKTPQSADGKASYGFKPLTEMSADDKYKGEDGGLYGGGRNDPPAAKKQTEKIVPLDSEGKPTGDGKIGLVSISMSNATQEYSRFKQIADADPQKSLRVAIVDCAQGGQAMAEWVDPKGNPWAVADKRLADASVSLKQVQVFAVRWLIQDQMKGDADLKFEDAAAAAPLLLWGPYFWADGTTPRKSDKLIWERADLGPDGTHPSTSGRQKVAEMLLKFFKEDSLAQTWFVKK